MPKQPIDHSKRAAGQPSFWKRRNFLVVAAAATLALAGGATYALWPKNYQASAHALAAQGPQAVRKAVESGQLPREVAWEAMGQVWEAEQQKRLDAFFALKTPAERTRHLDQMINEMEARRKEWETGAATRPSGDRDRRSDGPTSQPSDARRKEMEQRRNERADKQPPEKRAQRAEFMAAMRKRMQERGIQAPAGGRGGFGGGFGGPRGGGGGDRRGN